MRSFLRRYYLMLLAVAVCLFIFGFTGEIQAAQWGKGWYQNFFSSDSVCGEGEWTAEVNVFNTEAVPLTAGAIEIRAILWEGDMPTNVYNGSFSNTSTVVVCISAAGSPDDLMALDVRVSKTNYKDLWSYQRARPAGSAIANMAWVRDIYLAQNDEPVNIAHSFPVNNQVVSNSRNISFEIDALLRPGSSQIPEIIVEANNETTEEFFVKSFAPPDSMVQEGTIVFPSEEYPEGRYLWRARLMEDENNFLYPNLSYDQFILDTTPPVVDYPETSYPVSAEAQITLIGEAQDTLSGLKKIEVYLDNELKKTCSYSGTTLEQRCSVNVGVLGQGTFTIKVVAEDMGGLVKERTRTFIIGDKASMIFRAWGVGLSEDMQGVKYYHSSGFGSGKTYETTYSFESPNSIRTTLRFPVNISFEGEPYQFWGAAGCNLQYQFSSSYQYVICGASAGVGQESHVGALYSNSIQVITMVVNSWGFPADIKNISGTIGDFKEGETRKTSFTIKSYEPVTATLQAPATVSLSIPWIPLEEVVFSRWWRRSDYSHYGCDSASGRNCYIRGGALDSKLLYAYYVPAPNRLEVFSFVNRREVEGASISRVAGTWGTGGITRYLFSRNGVIDTTLRAPLSHGGETFSSWTGCDSQDTDARTCNIRSDTSGTKRIAANFGVGNVDPSSNHTLTVIMTGTDDDLVFVDPPGIDYAATEGEFSNSYPIGLNVDLRAIPSASSSFVWGGDCSGETTDTCVLTMDSDKTVTVDFELETITYDLTIFSTAGGSVTTPGEGTLTYTAGTVVDLIAVASSTDGYQFTGWTGDTSEIADVNASSTTITMNGDYFITANFGLITYELTIDSTVGGSVTTPGEGTITYDAGDVVNLVASAGSGYRFDNWTGDVSTIANVNASSTTITMNGDYSIIANFEEVPGPTAAMDCGIVDCGGPGCECNGSWVTYHGVHYKLWNVSTLPDSGTKYYSNWYYNGTQMGFPDCEENGGAGSTCHIETIAAVPSGWYNLRLVVEDEYGLSSSTTHPITVRNDIEADFQCSLDSMLGPWHNCTNIAPLVDQTVYLLDTSTHSDGATSIIAWEWEKGYMDWSGNFVPSGPPFANTVVASTTLTTATDTISLTAWDDIGRSDSVEKTLNVTLPLPEYREVAPVTRRDTFLSRLINVFFRF